MADRWWMAAGLALLASVAPCAAQDSRSDPDGPAVRAAAREALARAKVLDVVGLSRGVEGLLRELGAKVTAREIRIAMQAEVLFDFDKADLRAEAQDALGKVAEVVRANPGAVTVEGHTDAKGADAYNQRLSEKRAASVRDWLVAKAGVPPSRVRSVGFGEARPVAPNAKPDGSDDPEGRQRNRRVEIAIAKVP